MKHVKHGQMATKQMHENQSKFAHAAWQNISTEIKKKKKVRLCKGYSLFAL